MRMRCLAMDIRSTRTAALIIIAAAMLGACDDSTTIPPELQEQLRQQEQQQAALEDRSRPTTQQLTDESNFKRIRLDPLPLTLNVPPGWTLEPLGPRMLLEGYTPTDLVRIQLAQRGQVSQMHFEALQSGAERDEAAAEAAAQMSVEPREHQGMKLLEIRSIGRPISLPFTDSAGNPSMQTMTPARWKLMIFVPSGDGHEHYELNFIDLSLEQYEKDKQFLEKILHSVEYDGPMPATTPSR